MDEDTFRGVFKIVQRLHEQQARCSSLHKRTLLVIDRMVNYTRNRVKFNKLDKEGVKTMKKIGVITLIGTLLILGAFSVITFSKDRTVDEVLQAVMDKYEVQGYIVGEEPATIDIDVCSEEEIEKVATYMKSNLSDEDLNHYDIEVFSGWEDKLEKRG